jgi:hypothetical protein
MYREAAAQSERERPPAELVYDGIDRGGRRLPGVGLVQAFSLPVVIAGALSAKVSPTAGLVGLVVSGAAGVWWLRRPPQSGVVLRVEHGELLVIPRGKKEPKARFKLTNLTNVALDTKTIQRVEDGGSAIPAMRFADSRVGPELDTARIVLVPRQGSSLPLTEAHVAHMDATEWLGKIRVFLRKHGWVPADERGDEHGPDSIDEDEDEDEDAVG